ncbi:ATP-binding protein [Falsiroseomonas sp. HC035]|uniref:hybrid sensor histidine kinase/response regulator n=1 Tax=Falsiroseomonas sp. HC035 TaxID=3390999 RepID=UPI003D315E2B
MRRHLALFAAALALPILVFVAALSTRFATAERHRLEDAALDTARAVALAVDRDLNGMAATLNLLALSPQLRAGDIADFHRQTIELRERLGVTAVLRDATGRQILNAWQPEGAAPPDISSLPSPKPDADRVVVTDLFEGVAMQTPMFAVELPVPVPVEGWAAPLFLSLSAPATRIRQVLEDRQAPEGWTLAVVDGAGRILARNARHDDFIGQSATADLQVNTTGWEGTWRGTTAEGTEVLGTYARSAIAGWRIAVGVPDAVLTLPLRHTLLLLGGVGATLAGLSVMLALLVAHRIARPMRLLAAQAEAMGRGEQVAPVPTRVDEVAGISAALAEAARSLHGREEDLRRLNDALEARVGERTRDLAETNARLMAAAAGRARAEAQLRQSQKMEAVGRLTGGVAHDFNNLLTVVLGNLALARRRLGELPCTPAEEPVQDRLRRSLDNAAEGANRAAALTQRLLAFSRQQPLAPEVVDANRLVAGMSDLLRRTLGEDIEIETVLAGGLWRTHADPNQLESSLLNLAVNARDAMTAGGKLTIETANVHLDEAYVAGREDLAPGQYVAICVTDTGTGMSAEVISRAFEPFFTTKPVGQGTGLGLSQVYGFARQSGGHAAIYSEPGQGSTVKLYLPRLRDAEAAVLPRPTEVSRPAPDVAHSGGAVLVVEDESMVRDFAVTALEEAGYRVLAAADGPAALALLEAHPEVSLLFTDVVLAGPMNGREVAAAALARRPLLPVLFTTGYTRNAIIHQGRLDEGVNFIGKPYTAVALLDRVGRLLV